MEDREINTMEPYILFYSKIPNEMLHNSQQNNASIFKRKFSNGGNSYSGSLSGSFSKSFMKSFSHNRF